MERNNPLDKEITKHKFWSIRLLVLSGAMILVACTIATLWQSIGIRVEHTIWLGGALLLAFELNIAGFTIGFLEIHKNKLKARIVIIGNLLLILFLLVLVYYSLSFIE